MKRWKKQSRFFSFLLFLVQGPKILISFFLFFLLFFSSFSNMRMKPLCNLIAWLIDWLICSRCGGCRFTHHTHNSVRRCPDPFFRSEFLFDVAHGGAVEERDAHWHPRVAGGSTFLQHHHSKEARNNREEFSTGNRHRRDIMPSCFFLLNITSKYSMYSLGLFLCNQ